MRRIALALLVMALGAACGAKDDDGQAPANPTPTRAAAALLTPTPPIEPVKFPDDEAPHDAITEWWYYTGHIFDASGARYGFEYVFFQVNFGAFPTTYASHFAISDNAAGRFVYGQKSGLDAAEPAEGFAFQLDEWRMAGAHGTDMLSAATDEYAIDLILRDEKGPTLHGGIGYVELGPSGGSYYYSRTRMSVEGALTIEEEERAVTGEAWMDHQWGNFISVGAGWDWFAVQLDSGDELTISLVRDSDFNVAVAYGTLIAPNGTATHLTAEDFVVTPMGSWVSPHTNAEYPAAWRIEIPGRGWQLELTPSLPDQELDTRATTGTIYWEGEVEVSGSVAGNSVTGLGYVELTGYADALLPGS